MRKVSLIWLAATTGSVLLAFTALSEGKPATIKGTVQDGSKQAVAGAVVYLVPAGDVAKLAKPPSIDIKKDVPNDEPMGGQPRRQPGHVP